MLRPLAGDPRRPPEGSDPVPPRDGLPERLAELFALQLLVDLDTGRAALLSLQPDAWRPFTCGSTYGDKLLEADLLVLVGVAGDEDFYDLSHLVARQRETGLPEQLLQLEVAHVAAVINVCA